MMWMIFTGSFTTMYCFLDIKIHWFLKNILMGMSLMSLKTWARIREALKWFPYVEKDFNGPFESIWELA